VLTLNKILRAVLIALLKEASDSIHNSQENSKRHKMDEREDDENERKFRKLSNADVSNGNRRKNAKKAIAVAKPVK